MASARAAASGALRQHGRADFEPQFRCAHLAYSGCEKWTVRMRRQSSGPMSKRATWKAPQWPGRSKWLLHARLQLVGRLLVDRDAFAGPVSAPPCVKKEARDCAIVLAHELGQILQVGLPVPVGSDVNRRSGAAGSRGAREDAQPQLILATGITWPPIIASATGQVETGICSNMLQATVKYAHAASCSILRPSRWPSPKRRSHATQPMTSPLRVPISQNCWPPAPAPARKSATMSGERIG